MKLIDLRVAHWVWVNCDLSGYCNQSLSKYSVYTHACLYNVSGVIL